MGSEDDGRSGTHMIPRDVTWMKGNETLRKEVDEEEEDEWAAASAEASRWRSYKKLLRYDRQTAATWLHCSRSSFSYRSSALPPPPLSPVRPLFILSSDDRLFGRARRLFRAARMAKKARSWSHQYIILRTRWRAHLFRWLSL